MIYELAKALKNHGFVQPPIMAMGLMIPKDIVHPDADPQYYYPSFEEIVRACGEGFHSLLKTEINLQVVWEAHWSDKVGKGSTPTEAVARLWLVLNPPPLGINVKETVKANDKFGR